MPDKITDLTPSPEKLPTRELNRAAAEFIDTLSIVPGEIAAESDNQSSPLFVVLGQIAARFCDFSDPDQLSCQIKVRRIREENDELMIREGDDPGIHLIVKNLKGEMAEINIYGGLRSVSAPMDLKDSSTSFSKGFGHAERTNSIVSQPTIIGVDVYDSQGRRQINTWFNLTGEAVAPDYQGITITALNYIDPKTSLQLNQPLAYPHALALGIVKPLRDKLQTLQQIRGAAWL